MKRKHKLYFATAVFLMLATAAMAFILRDLGGETPTEQNYSPKTISGHNDESKENNNSMSKASGIENSSKNNLEKIDWQTIIEKWRGKEISKINTDKKFVALTFDAGGSADGVDEILKTLKEENVEGSFFLTGRFIEKYPDCTKKIADFSKDLGNHGYSHPHMVQLDFSKEQVNQELEKTEKLLSNFGVSFKPFFRFPFGERNGKYIQYINDKNYISVRWSVDSLGWKGISGGMTKESVRDRVVGKTTPGAIILMHMGSNPDDGTNLDSEALPEIIQELKNQGYEFASLTELLTNKD